MTNVTAFFDERGIVHETTATYSSFSNGIAECFHHTLFNMVRPRMIKSRGPTPFCAEVVAAAN